jgi:hypothetical protein
MLDGMTAGVLLINLAISDLGVALWVGLRVALAAGWRGTAAAGELRRLGLEKELAALRAADEEAGG